MDDIDAALALREWLTFKDLQDLGVVRNWQGMSEWQKRFGFPLGKLFGPNSRRWSRAEVEAWIENRPALRCDFAGAPTKPGAKHKPGKRVVA
jgi:hypothetical protein